MPFHGQYEVTDYMPSHRQFRLSDSITPEKITELTGATPTPSKDGKCRYQWEFFVTFTSGPNNDRITLPCSIWDYSGCRWSAWGPRKAFVAMGLLPPE